MQYSSPFILSFLLLLTLPLIFLLAPRILSPKTLLPISVSEEAEDLALFRRATLASADVVGGASTRRRPPSPPKIAFMFLVNSDIAFAPLWEHFFRGHEQLFNIYVHADPAAELKLQPSKSFEDRFILAKPKRRASPMLISAAHRLLTVVLLDVSANAFFALVSQHCIPLHSFNYAYNSLLGPSGPHCLSFIEIISDDPSLWICYIAYGDNVMLPEIPFEHFCVGS